MAVARAITLPPLAKPVPEGVDPAVELLKLLPVVYIETRYPALAQLLTRPNERSPSEKVC